MSSLTQYWRVTDGWRHRQTDAISVASTALAKASIAACCKNEQLNITQSNNEDLRYFTACNEQEYETTTEVSTVAALVVVDVVLVELTVNKSTSLSSSSSSNKDSLAFGCTVFGCSFDTTVSDVTVLCCDVD